MIEINLEQANKVLETHEKNSNVNAFKHISYKEKMDKSYEELIWTDPLKVIKWWWAIWDEVLWWIYWWKIYAIWAPTWFGKSTFTNNLANSLSKQWIKVTKYSLEDRMEDIWKEDLFSYANRVRYWLWLPLWQFPHFVNNEYTHPNWKFYDEDNIKYIIKAKEILEEHNKNITELDKSKQVSVEDMVRLMEEEAKNWTKVFIIDHLHYFKKSWWARVDLEIESIMQEINEVARNYNVAVFLVAHYKKLNWDSADDDSFKDASWIKQVANITIHISREWEMTRFDLKKLRWKLKCKWFLWVYDINTDSYTSFSQLLD